jgi:TetR/AcrR family transcriptional regulator, regulator of cefoperazone and chloramphenicol sensitivity
VCKIHLKWLFECSTVARVPETPTSETGRRLLAAATNVFADYGYHRATIAEICRAAAANVAAVNYHFGDKLKLYTVVWRQAYEDFLREVGPIEEQLSIDGDPVEQLRTILIVRLGAMRGQEHEPVFFRLMSNEFTDPSPALPQIVEDAIRPRAMVLWAVLQRLLGDVDEAILRRCVICITAQLVFFAKRNPVHQHLFPEADDDPQVIADHILRFSLSGVNGFAPGVWP